MNFTHFKLCCLVFVGILLFGCSNQSSVSIDATDNSKTAAFDDVFGQDICANGSNIWVVTLNPTPSDSDYYLAKFNTSTQYWQQSSHYGTRVAAAGGNEGACFHINSANQIWCGKLDGSSEQIPNPPNQTRLIDIGCGQYGSYDYVWVISEDNSGNRSIWKYRPQYSPQWVDVTNGRTGAVAIAVDPSWGNRAAIIDYAAGVFSTTNQTSWYVQSGAPTRCTDIGIDGTKIVLFQFHTESIYTGYGSTFTNQHRAYWNSVCADADKYYYFGVNLDPQYNSW